MELREIKISCVLFFRIQDRLIPLKYLEIEDVVARCDKQVYSAFWYFFRNSLQFASSGCEDKAVPIEVHNRNCKRLTPVTNLQ